MNAANLLEKLTTECHSLCEQGQMPVVVFDLDHTLFDNGPRTWEILREYASAASRNDLLSALDALPRLGLPYLLSETLTMCNLYEDALHDAALKYWFDRFFTDEYQKHDVPLPGAVAFAEQLYGAGATLVYLSGRDSPGMLVGCTESLRTHRFPVGLARTAIVLKPDFETPDIDFKTSAVEYIRTQGTVIATFDNEPANCNLFHSAWPEAANVFLDTAHAPNPPPLSEGMLHLRDFALS